MALPGLIEYLASTFRQDGSQVFTTRIAQIEAYLPASNLDALPPTGSKIASSQRGTTPSGTTFTVFTMQPDDGELAQVLWHLAFDSRTPPDVLVLSVYAGGARLIDVTITPEVIQDGVDTFAFVRDNLPLTFNVENRQSAAQWFSCTLQYLSVASVVDLQLFRAVVAEYRGAIVSTAARGVV